MARKNRTGRVGGKHGKHCHEDIELSPRNPAMAPPPIPKSTINRPQKADSKLSKRDIFPFFDLPRELRDEIYELLPVASKADSNRYVKLQADSTKTNFMLVCKQFNQEYAKATKKRTTVEMEITCFNRTDQIHGESGHIFLSLRGKSLEISSFCWGLTLKSTYTMN